MRRRLGVVLFLAIAFSIPCITLVLAGGYPGTEGILLASASPAVAALFAQGALGWGPLLRSLGLSLRPTWWWALAWLAPFVLSAGFLGASLSMPGFRFSPILEEPRWVFESKRDPRSEEPTFPREILTPRGLGTERPAEGKDKEWLLRRRPVDRVNWVARPVVTTVRVSVWRELKRSICVGSPLLALHALGEEIGWRGYLWREVLPLGFWRASFVTGVFWGLWHGPTILLGWSRVPSEPLLALLFQVGSCVLLSPLLGWIRIRSRSVVPVAVAHGSLNASMWLPSLVEPRESLLAGKALGLAGALVLLAAWGALALGDRTLRGRISLAVPDPPSPRRR